ncbi:MAG: NAD(P)H-quinone oxidoreductase subunit L [Prochloron sp. SP5CPC1]|nr:NAD(P)H-quinone oxidoreductase subunit L [Candidatus Paraprochloron terpiosi SP5CPC1]
MISIGNWPPETILLALVYLTLSLLYLLIGPGILYFYLKIRWYVASSVERTLMYFLVFLFFPGLLLLSPVLNFRPKRRQIAL